MSVDKVREDDGTSVTVKLRGARMAFPSVFKKDKYDRYSASFILEPGKFPVNTVLKVLEDESKRAAGMKALRAAAETDNYAKVLIAIIDVARAKWGVKWLATLKLLFAKSDICLQDGDLKPDVDGYPGNFVLSATNKTRPALLDRNRNDIDESSGLLYSGSHPIAVVEVWAQDNQAKGWRRINCQLQGLQHFKEGERFGGGRIASKDEFEDLGDPDDAGDDLLGGDADDDIPF